MMFSPPQEPSVELWKANWQLSQVKDYKDTPSLIDWCEPFHLEEGKNFDGLPFPLSLKPKEDNEPLEVTLQHLKRSHELVDKVSKKNPFVLLSLFSFIIVAFYFFYFLKEKR